MEQMNHILARFHARYPNITVKFDPYLLHSTMLREGSPDGYTLMLDGAVAVINGEQTPQQAADALQAGLAQWFEPAKECGK